MAAYVLDAEVAAYVARSEAGPPAGAETPGIAQRRADYERMCEAFRRPYPPGLAAEDGAFAAERPARRIPWRRYRPQAPAPGRAVLYMHGGGWVLGSLASHDSICADLADAGGVTLLALDYRLSPEHRYPAALDDAEAAYAALVAAGNRVVVAGDSAGGNLAAALCLRLRRLGQTLPLAQLLIYPGLSPLAGRAAGTWRESVPMLTAAQSREFRAHYTGADGAAATADPELAPLAATDFFGLPPAAIFAADIDPLAQDSHDYAAALRGAGVPVRLHEGHGLVHGYLRGRHESARIGAAFAQIGAALREQVQAPG